MIEQEIITVSPEKPSLESDPHIPEWIKKSAWWWHNGMLPEKDFVFGIKYLVEQGIIRV